MRTCAILIVVAGLLAAASGCHPSAVSRATGSPVGTAPADTSWRGQSEIPPRQAKGPPVDLAAASPSPGFSTVLSSNLPERRISLAECIALALENGRTGIFFDGPGSNQKTSVSGLTFQANPSAATDSVRVLAYDPAITATEIEESLARFDVWHETSLFWNRTDRRNRFLTPPTPFEEFTNRAKVDDMDFQSGLFKRLSTGGFAGLFFRSDYEKNFLPPNSNILDPAYRSAVEMTFEQPLLQGSGVFINQLRDFHPGSLRRTLPDNGKAPGILLVRIGHRQTQLEFERRVQELVYRVEEAYWQLQCAYWDLYSSDNGMRQAHAAWQIAKARFDAGGIGVEDLAMIEEQYHFFRTQRVQALGRGQPGRPGVLEAERRLRYVVGLPPEDGTRLIPIDPPAFVFYEPDLECSIADARARRPELLQVEEEIRAAQLHIARAADRLLPDLRFVSRYNLNGLGEDFGEGVADLATSPRHEWELGLRLLYPIGARAGYAETRRAKLQLAQRLAFLKDQQEKLLFSLQRSYRDLIQAKEQYRIRQSQRLAAARQLQARYDKFQAGGDPKQPGSFIDLLLRAQRNWVDALREEYVALCDYRTAIADFERQKGTILSFANVSIEQGPLVEGAIPHASRYIRDWHEKQPPAEIARTGPESAAPPAAPLHSEIASVQMLSPRPGEEPRGECLIESHRSSEALLGPPRGWQE